MVKATQGWSDPASPAQEATLKQPGEKKSKNRIRECCRFRLGFSGAQTLRGSVEASIRDNSLTPRPLPDFISQL